METWIWISLYIIQTLVSAVLWRKYAPKTGYWRIDSGLLALVPSMLLIPNIVMITVFCFRFLDYLIDYLAGVKKTEENDNI